VSANFFGHLETDSLTYKQFLSKEKAMKRIIILAMVLVMLLTSIGGCWVPWDEGGRGGRGEGHDRGEGHEERH
jgi:hypothetical protein